MNILVFSWRDPKHPLAGGAEQSVHEHIKAWLEAGHKVTFFSSRFRASPPKEVLDGVEIIRKGNQYLGVHLAGFFYYLKNRQKYDFIVDQFHGIPFFTPLYVRKPKLAILQETAREVWFLNHLPRPFNWIVGLTGYCLEPLIFLLYRRLHFMTGSESAKKAVILFGVPEQNITVVPHGLKIHKSRSLPLNEEKYTITYLGVLAKDKGIEDALHCFTLLNNKNSFRFWVIGREENAKYGRKIQNLTQELGLNNKVKFWGFVSQQKKFELLSRTNLLINPSVREGWGLVNIEANAAGVPVVAYNVPGCKDSVKNGKTGVLIEKGNVAKMASVVLRLKSDQDFYQKLRRGAVSWSKKFTWQKSRKKSLKLIENL